MSVYSVSNALIDGDPLDPSPLDLILQRGRLAVGERVPEGWNVLTGNVTDSLVVRVAYRYVLED